MPKYRQNCLDNLVIDINILKCFRPTSVKLLLSINFFMITRKNVITKRTKLKIFVYAIKFYGCSYLQDHSKKIKLLFIELWLFF